TTPTSFLIRSTTGGQAYSVDRTNPYARLYRAPPLSANVPRPSFTATNELGTYMSLPSAFEIAFTLALVQEVRDEATAAANAATFARTSYTSEVRPRNNGAQVGSAPGTL